MGWLNSWMIPLGDSWHKHACNGMHEKRSLMVNYDNGSS